MTRQTILASIATVLTLLVAPAGNALLIENENAYEVFAHDVILPSENVGNLILKECSSCPSVVLRVNAASRAYIDEEQVSFRELQKKAASVKNKAMYVFYTIDEKVVTRVVLDL